MSNMRLKETIESVLFLILLFGTLYVALWTFCPCGEYNEVSHNEHAELTNN